MKTVTRLSLLMIAGASLATAALGADRTEVPAPRNVTYLNVGQSRVVLPAGSLTRPEAPYALSGERRAADAWEREGHWVNAGQTRVFVPAVRGE